jgi:hypothetical protein
MKEGRTLLEAKEVVVVVVERRRSRRDDMDFPRKDAERTYLHLPARDSTKIIGKKIHEHLSRRTTTSFMAAVLIDGDDHIPGLSDLLDVAFDPVSVHMVTSSEFLPLFYHGLGDGVRRLLLLNFDVPDIRILAVSAHPSTSSSILCHPGQCQPQELNPSSFNPRKASASQRPLVRTSSVGTQLGWCHCNTVVWEHDSDEWFRAPLRVADMHEDEADIGLATSTKTSTIALAAFAQCPMNHDA